MLYSQFLIKECVLHKCQLLILLFKTGPVIFFLETSWRTLYPISMRAYISLTNASPQLKRHSTDAFDNLLTMCHLYFLLVRKVVVCLNLVFYFDLFNGTVDSLVELK